MLIVKSTSFWPDPDNIVETFREPIPMVPVDFAQSAFEAVAVRGGVGSAAQEKCKSANRPVHWTVGDRGCCGFASRGRRCVAETEHLAEYPSAYVLHPTDVLVTPQGFCALQGRPRSYRQAFSAFGTTSSQHEPTAVSSSPGAEPVSTFAADIGWLICSLGHWCSLSRL